jgi:hypothetical protein
MKNEALMRVEPEKLDELLHPVFDVKALKKLKLCSRITSFSWSRNRKNCIH